MPTIKSETLKDENYVKIKGQLYKKNTEAINHKGLWYRVSSPKVTKDYSTGLFVHINDTSNMSFGLVDKNVFGYFSKSNSIIRGAMLVDVKSPLLSSLSRSINCISESGPTGSPSYYEVKNKSTEKEWCRVDIINEEVAEVNGFVECYSSEIMYRKSDCTPDMLRALKFKSTPNDAREKNQYNLSDNKNDFAKLVKNYDLLVVTPNKRHAEIALQLNNYTFGLEFEFVNGFIPNKFKSLYSLKALRDGSVAHTGTELVTIPLSGSKGVYVLDKIVNKMSDRCDIDLTCALHIHFGNIATDKNFVIALWCLAVKIQKELFSYMPISRSSPKHNDGKIYCKYLPDLNVDTKSLLNPKNKEEYDNSFRDTFSRIYSFLNGEAPGTIYKTTKNKISFSIEDEIFYTEVLNNERYTSKSKRHSVQGSKWNRTQRYYWLNLMNLYFSDYNTVEFRCHEGTVNPTKTFCWLLICSSILKYAEINPKKCLDSGKVSLDDILRVLSLKDYTFVSDYLADRKKSLYASGKDPYVLEHSWLTDDSSYTLNNQKFV
jgi:hypothetical protein